VLHQLLANAAGRRCNAGDTHRIRHLHVSRIFAGFAFRHLEVKRHVAHATVKQGALANCNACSD
jgi:hypothetical protein